MRSGGLWRLALRRIGTDRAVAALAWLLLVAAAALPATGLLYSERVAIGSLRAEFAAAAPADRTVRVSIGAPLGEVDRVDAAVSAEVGRAIAGAAPVAAGAPTGAAQPGIPPEVPPGVVRVVRSGGLVMDPVGGGTGHAGGAAPAAGDLVVVASFDDIASHAALVTGAWAQPNATPVEATLSEGAAAALALPVGATVTVRDTRDPSRTSTVRVVGIWRPQRADAYWEADPLDLSGTQTVRLTTRGPFVVARADLARAVAGTDVVAEWRGLPAPESLTPAASDALVAALGQLPGRVQAIVGSARAAPVATGLPDLLSRLARATFVGRELVVLLVAQLAVLAGYALLLVGNVLAGRRRRENALLRERGAGSSHVAAVALIEGLMLAAPAAFAATLVAWLAVGALAGGGAAASAMPGDPATGTFVVAVVAAGLGALALAFPALAATGSLPRLRASLGRRVGATLAQRLGLDLVLVALAAIGIWQLRSYGASAAGASGGAAAGPGPSLDLVLVLAPAVGLLAGALVVNRIVPRVAELAERALGDLRGLVVALGGREVARRPERHTRVALLVVIAAGLGGLASAHAATWVRSQQDQAAYRAVADIRVLSGPAAGLPGWLAGPAYRAIPGVSAATGVLDRGIETGPAAGGQLLALDPVAVAALPDPPASLRALAPALASLAQGQPASPGIALPTGVRRLAITLDAAIGPPPDDSGVVPSGLPTPGVDVRLYLRDADGRVTTVEAGTAAPDAKGSRLEVSLARPLAGRMTAPDPGLQLLGVELGIAAPQGMTYVGTVELRGVQSSSTDAPAAGPWNEIAVDPAASGWGWLRIDDSRSASYAPPAGHWGRVLLGTGAGMTPPAGHTVLPTRFRLWTAPDIAVPLPAIVNQAFLERTGAAVGDEVDGQMVGDGVRLRIAGTTDLCPPLDPGRPLVVVDRSWLELARLGSGGGTLDLDEWWLTTAPSAGLPATTPSPTDALLAAPFLARAVIERSALLAAGARDPVSLGIIGALGLGAIAALVFATIGYVVHAAISTRERVAELALLRALGVSGRQVLGWLWVEHASILAFSLLAGSGLGLLLSWLVIPSATLTPEGLPPVPAPELVMPLAFIVGLVLAGAALLALTVPVMARLVRRIDVAAVLREDGG